MSKTAQLDLLRVQNRALADANAQAAELMAELEEARALEEMLRRRGEELELQTAIDAAITQAEAAEPLARFALTALAISRETGLEPEAIAFVRRDQLAPGHFSPRPPGTPESREIPVIPPVPGAGSGPLVRLAALGHPDQALLVAAVEESLAGEAGPLAVMRPDGIVVVPLTVTGRFTGALVFRVRPCGEWAERWLGQLSSFGRQIGTALERIRTENENRRIREELVEARDRALEASRAKSTFLANMSHELRTPLNAIIGYSELVAEETTDLGHPDLAADLAKITSAGKHLLGLINDILELSQLEAGKSELKIEDVAVKDLLEEVAGLAGPAIEERRNTLVLDVEEDLPLLATDEAKLRQVLRSLLGNAAKFTEGGRIHLRASREARPSGPRVVFQVEDSGIGMTEDDQHRIFEAFSQADGSTTRAYAGTGLGLAITQRTCVLMGGDVTVRSQPGVGTLVSFWLPERFVPGG